MFTLISSWLATIYFWIIGIIVCLFALLFLIGIASAATNILIRRTSLLGGEDGPTFCFIDEYVLEFVSGGLYVLSRTCILLVIIGISFALLDSILH
jgi:ABC-type Fe3+ transport system permease subunit